MGLFSFLRKKTKKIDVEKFTPYIGNPRIYQRGVDTFRMRIPYEKDIVQGFVILIWQPKNHSFLHIVYDVKTDEKSIKYHDGFNNINPGSIDIRKIVDFDEMLISWDISDTWALDDHYVESYLFLGDMIAQYETKLIHIIEKQQSTMSDEDKDKLKKLLEKNNKSILTGPTTGFS